MQGGPAPIPVPAVLGQEGTTMSATPLRDATHLLGTWTPAGQSGNVAALEQCPTGDRS